MRKPKCVDCGKEGPSICDRCRKERNRLRALRRQNERRGEITKPPDGHEERILYYMDRAERGLPLFRK